MHETAEHEVEIEAIKDGELGVDWIEGGEISAAGFTVTDDSLFIGPDDRVYRLVRGERNLARVESAANQITVLDGNRVVGSLVSLSANEPDEQNAAHTRAELQARQFEAHPAVHDPDPPLLLDDKDPPSSVAGVADRHRPREAVGHQLERNARGWLHRHRTGGRCHDRAGQQPSDSP